jgi:hypothetical protein
MLPNACMSACNPRTCVATVPSSATEPSSTTTEALPTSPPLTTVITNSSMSNSSMTNSSTTTTTIAVPETSSSSDAATLGGIIGGIIALLLIIAIIVTCIIVRRRRNNKDADPQAPAAAAPARINQYGMIPEPMENEYVGIDLQQKSTEYSSPDVLNGDADDNDHRPNDPRDARTVYGVASVLND